MTKQHKEEIEQAKTLVPSSKNKRINTVAKGRRNEKRTEKWLEEHGWVVQTTRRSSYKGGSNDFFGLFDHIAVCNAMFTSINQSKKKKNSIVQCEISRFKEGNVLFVQTKSNRVSKKTIDDILNFAGNNKAVFVWHDNIKEPEIIIITNSKFF